MPDPNQPNPSHPKSIAETLASFANLSASFQKLQSDFNSSKPTDRVTDWAPTASQCLERTVDFVVVYNPKTTSRGVNNYQFQVIAHACRISETEVIAAKEAYDFAVKLARLRSGKIMIVCEMQWFDFEPDAVDETSGLILCGNLKRDEASWEDFKNMWMIRGLKQETPTKFSHVKGTMMPYIGNEICFAHTGEAENIWPGTLQLTAKQFDTSQISHFQKPGGYGFRIQVLCNRRPALENPLSRFARL